MITIRRDVLKQCPFKDEADHGHLTIRLPGDAPELHALADAVTGMCEKPVSHEDFTRAVRAILPAGAVVTTRWETAGWDVECAEGDS